MLPEDRPQECRLTAAVCAGLLVRQYRMSATPVLLWSAACFVLLAVSNLLVVIDLLLLPTQVDLSIYRQLSNLAAVSTLLYGFIQEVD